MVHDYVPFIHAAIKQQEDARTDLAAHSQVIGHQQHLQFITYSDLCSHDREREREIDR